MKNILLKALAIACPLLLWLQLPTAQAQLDAEDSTNLAAGKRPWYLSVGADVKVKSLQGKYDYYYLGEYNKYDGWWGNGDNNWVWQENKASVKNLFKTANFYNLNMEINLSRNERFTFGLFYNVGLTVLNPAYDTALHYPGTLDNSEVLVYLAIGPRAEYYYYLKKGATRSAPFLYGSLAGGMYRGDAFLDGAGTQLFGQARLGGGYKTGNGWIIRLFASVDKIRYRDKSISPVFNREQQLKIDLLNSYIGLGFVKQFSLVPD